MAMSAREFQRRFIAGELDLPKKKIDPTRSLPDEFTPAQAEQNDAYFDGLGDLVEEHPIGAVHAARIRRG